MKEQARALKEDKEKEKQRQDKKLDMISDFAAFQLVLNHGNFMKLVTSS